MGGRVVERLARPPRDRFAEIEDRLLVLDFQDGDSDGAYDEIYRRYVGLARHICLRILEDPEDAEEATQETMLKVFRGLHRFNGRYAIRPWVARIATNVAFDALRARHRHPQPADRPLDELMILDDREPAVLLERQLDQERLQATLNRLRPNHRYALVLREVEGRSHEEMAELLGTTPKQVKALICRARKAFRRAWDAREGPFAQLRGAISAIVLLPFRVPELVRRLFGYARHTAEFAAALPDAAASGIATADRVAAAAMTVLIAGTTVVSVAAATPRVGPPVQPESPITVSAPEPRAGSVLVVPGVPEAAADAQGNGPTAVPTNAATTPTPVPTPSPTASPTTASPTAPPTTGVPTEPPTTVSPTVPASPSLEPSTTFPTTPPIPAPLAPPMLSFEVLAGYECNCGEIVVTSTLVEVSADDGFAFRQEAVATIQNPTEGGSPWSIELSVWGTPGDGYTSGFILTVHQDVATYRYGGTSAASVTSLERGGYRYASSGTYGRTGDLLADEPPAVLDGTFTLLVDTAPNGSSLTETHLILSGS